MVVILRVDFVASTLRKRKNVRGQALHSDGQSIVLITYVVFVASLASATNDEDDEGDDCQNYENRPERIHCFHLLKLDSSVRRSHRIYGSPSPVEDQLRVGRSGVGGRR